MYGAGKIVSIRSSMLGERRSTTSRLQVFVRYVILGVTCRIERQDSVAKIQSLMPAHLKVTLRRDMHMHDVLRFGRNHQARYLIYVRWKKQQ